MPKPPHNSRVAVVRPAPDTGEPLVLLIKCLPVPNRPEDDVFYEVPGGDAIRAETPRETAGRELRQETGFKARAKSLREVYKEELADHVKYGFLMKWRDRRSRLKAPGFDDGNKRIVGYDWVRLSDALKLITPGLKGSSQHNFLKAVSRLPREELI